MKRLIVGGVAALTVRWPRQHRLRPCTPGATSTRSTRRG